MRLERILAQGLFGVFHHDIRLKLDERITIISGPNGFGKTVILRMINALLTGNITFLRSVPFDRFTLTFDDGTAIEAVHSPRDTAAVSGLGKALPPSATKMPRSRRKGTATTSGIEIFRIAKDGTRSAEARPSPMKLPPRLLHAIDRYIPGMQLVGDVWQSQSGEQYSAEDVIAEYRDRIPEQFLSQVESLPGMRDIQDAIHVQFISTQRLSASRSAPPSGVRVTRSFEADFVEFDQDEEFYEPSARRHPSLAVVQYSDETAGHIKSLLERYGARSQELDRTFPERLLKQDRLPALAPEDLRRRLKELEAKRANLVELGFLDREEQGISEPVEQAIKEKGDVLSVYVQDTEKKLSVFDEMADKIGFFVKNINERFKYKKMAISRDKGFVFTSKIGPLAPEDLSSGEQHELVLLYELLFKVNRTWLVLIDEPEISLHVGWQENFVRDLQEIIKLSAVDIVVATHSPVIVGDHWNLTVELSGPENGSDADAGARTSA